MSCGRSVVFSGYSGFLHQINFRHYIIELLLKVALNTITIPPLHEGHIILIPTRRILILLCYAGFLVEKEQTHILSSLVWSDRDPNSLYYYPLDVSTLTNTTHAHPVKQKILLDKPAVQMRTHCLVVYHLSQSRHL